jgi:hypothetical protein
MIPPNKQFSGFATWGFLQVFLLVICASAFPLWTHHPFPRESLAFEEMICGQALIFAILGPYLATGARGLAMAVAVTLPIDELAGLLADLPQAMILKGFVSISIWIIGLAGLTGLLKGSGQLWILMLGMLYTAGGAILDYLRAEARAGQNRPTDWNPISLLPNICLIIKHQSRLGWAEVSLPLLLSILVRITRKLSPRAQIAFSTFLHRSSFDPK